MRVIAIDGPAGSGKTSLARALAERLDLECLDTGAMYRAVTFAVLRAGGDPADDGFTANVARTVDLRVEADRVLVDGVDATVEIRGSSVDRAVSLVAANAAVRAELVARQRDWARRRGGGVVEGRDIGTVVFPDADLKVYLKAEERTRALRRAHQRAAADPGAAAGAATGVEAAAVESVAEDLARRDSIDSNRKADPLARADDAVVVDTTERTFDETVEQILSLL
ncbi:MAG: (d)CMP kinase [Acidimicrobiaceae bacterium]|nr:(d)CMP kinase [Acidimicrobiaceae bacterium]MCY4175305.1 (d)CMP kinase [Acidimicrobiaceae bacterium]MCY4279661.1 (d)CMP kinase [Acidimicrobiaceae bacterium]MCY4293389.1 (d)CMP kinase [Acidimicrobiaceae bacterium]